MIRIFITAILYLITMFTQAQEKPGGINEKGVFSSVNKTEENCGASCEMQNSDLYRFNDTKFEVKEKDLTFEMRF